MSLKSKTELKLDWKWAEWNVAETLIRFLLRFSNIGKKLSPFLVQVKAKVVFRSSLNWDWFAAGPNSESPWEWWVKELRFCSYPRLRTCSQKTSDSNQIKAKFLWQVPLVCILVGAVACCQLMFCSSPAKSHATLSKLTACVVACHAKGIEAPSMYLLSYEPRHSQVLKPNLWLG